MTDTTPNKQVFWDCLSRHLSLHPSIQPADIFKFCYQAAFGAEHLLSDLSSAKTWFNREYSLVSPRNVPVFEPLNHDLCRVDIGAWKYRSLSSDLLFRLFCQSAHPAEDGNCRMTLYLSLAGKAVASHLTNFPLSHWQSELTRYKADGIRAIHHSTVYREQEQPAYRVVSRRYVELLPLLTRIPLDSSVPFVLAIDGRAASGKTTLAGHLREITKGSMISVDDFFLPPVLRTAERLRSPGGNLHYERFCGEVLPHLSSPDAFSYRVFDCGQMAYCGEKTVPCGSLRIVEGSYSLHPQFGHYASLSVFCDVSPEEQAARILTRNGQALAKRFREEWIPMEEQYFQYFSITDKADFNCTFSEKNGYHIQEKTQSEKNV